jgi:prepilin-type N-terminal cleavage/methylation domain-containing protein
VNCAVNAYLSFAPHNRAFINRAGVPLQTERQQGFTLIELSVVLVIIGLIVGSIIAGQSLIRSSQVQSASTDTQTYIRAVQAFQQKYNALPGDMANATSYWGIAGGSAGTNYTTDCYTVQGTGTQTCDGNGNGQIADGVISGTNTYANEELRAWQHLADAGFIQGSYTGVAGSGGALDAVPGTNVPQSRVSSAGYTISWYGVLSSNANYFNSTYGHVIVLSGRNTTTGTPVASVLTTSEALSFDQKFDDGLPATGNILAPTPSLLANCATTSVSSTAVYEVGSSGNQCFLIFKTGF